MKARISLVLFALVAETLGLATRTAAGWIVIHDVQIVPPVPTPVDSITIVSAGEVGSLDSKVDHAEFSQADTTLQLDIFIQEGLLPAIGPWSHSQPIGVLPGASYTLSVRTFDWPDLTLADTYRTSFTVAPEPSTWTGNGGPGSARWDVAGNWFGNAAPSDSDVTFGVSFNNGDTIDLNGSRSAQVMTFTNANAHDLTFVNGTVALTGITKRFNSGSVTFADTVAVNVAGGATIENNGTGGQIAFSGKVSLEGAGATFTGAQPMTVGGSLSDNGYGLTNNGTLLAPGTILAAGLGGSGSVQVTGGGRLSAQHIRQNQLQVSGGGKATIGTTAVANAPDSTSRLNLLALVGPTLQPGTLDLNNNSLILDYTGPLGNILSDVTAQIHSGRNGTDPNDQANWNGQGIITTKGRQDNVAAKFDLYNLGAINNADLDLMGIGPSLRTFGGQAVTPNTVLVKYTYSGDANLDGLVDGDDYSYWLNGFLNLTDPAIQGWLRGDFNYDARVDADDYTQWLNSFLFAGPPLTGGSPAPVPEPATLALLGIAATGLLALDRQKRRRLSAY